MSGSLGSLTLTAASAVKRVAVDDYLTPEAAESAEAEANHWIKSLRHVSIDDTPFRDRFTLRGDSLWWFAELYLHKRRIVAQAFRAAYALDAAIDRESPRAIGNASDPVVAHLAAHAAARWNLSVVEPARGTAVPGWWKTRTKAVLHTMAALADRLRPGAGPPSSGRPTVTAFVHSAFWRTDDNDEAYIGPVLRELADRLPDDAVHLIGVGPRTNFRVRRWRDRATEFVDPRARHLPITPVENYAPWERLRPSLELWRDRHAIERALVNSRALREVSVVKRYDIWPLVRHELAGIAVLQFPWSARAMDEAAAALDQCVPRLVLTYAEAGGWGRALMLEARRRNIATVALQHGFIYRHWLNYVHEEDELVTSSANPQDRGFPRPDLTLVFDGLAEAHLVDRAHFPRSAVMVTGSPRLDQVVAHARRLTATDRDALLGSLGARNGQPVVIVATKYSQIASLWSHVVRAADALNDAVVIVKPHPADDPGAYTAGVSARNLRVAPAGLELGALLAVARALVTVNSTAAIEAMALDVPALIVALPNNLSPFVEAEAMVGAHEAAEIGPRLQGLLYDEGLRSRLSWRRTVFMTDHGIRPDGSAARRAAEAIVQRLPSL